MESDRGKVAYQRGPLVYCFEDKDNGEGWMFDLFVPRDGTLQDQFEGDLLGGVTTLTLDGLRVTDTGADPTLEPIRLKAIPYYAWNSRGAANMRVWMSEGKESVCAKSTWGKEMGATASSSLDWVWGLNSGFDPRSSADIDKSNYYFWQSEHREEWVQYDFKESVALSESKVYWLNLDAYDGSYRVPESWNLMVQDAKQRWVPVVTRDPYGLELDKYNTVTFDPVKTSAIRMNVRLPQATSAGILAWKVS